MIPLATLDDVRAYPGMNTASQADSAWINILINSFSQIVENRTNRKLEYKSYVEYASPVIATRFIQLQAFGLSTGTITTVHEDVNGVFGADTLVEASDYQMEPESGLLARRYTYWMPGWRAVKITYQGGLFAANEDAPSDLKMACIMQVAFWYQRRNELGLTQKTQTGGAVSIQGSSRILPEVDDIINNYTLHQIAGGVITDYSGFI